MDGIFGGEIDGYGLVPFFKYKNKKYGTNGLRTKYPEKISFTRD